MIAPARIVYLQYTNPAAYPPLQHSSRIFADSGWDVLFLGTGSLGADLLEFPHHDRIDVRRIRFRNAGALQKLHYLWFCLWSIASTLRWRAKWVYASDPYACPPALVLAALFRIRLVYHEHDSPANHVGRSLFMRLCLWARSRCASLAVICVLPNRERAERFAAENKAVASVKVVWNCPSRKEVVPLPRPPAAGSIKLLYHGSIVPDRVPRALIEALVALPEEITLDLTGYETIGSQGYLAGLRQLASDLGVGTRLTINRPRSRETLMAECSNFDVGVAFVPRATADANFVAMTGASNKPFDYLACGLTVLVSDLPDWRAMFVETGYGLACDPADPASIASAVLSFYQDPAAMRAMGERGRQRILAEWNYEMQFERLGQAWG